MRRITSMILLCMAALSTGAQAQTPSNADIVKLLSKVSEQLRLVTTENQSLRDRIAALEKPEKPESEIPDVDEVADFLLTDRKEQLPVAEASDVAKALIRNHKEDLPKIKPPTVDQVADFILANRRDQLPVASVSDVAMAIIRDHKDQLPPGNDATAPAGMVAAFLTQCSKIPGWDPYYPAAGRVLVGAGPHGASDDDRNLGQGGSPLTVYDPPADISECIRFGAAARARGRDPRRGLQSYFPGDRDYGLPGEWRHAGNGPGQGGT